MIPREHSVAALRIVLASMLVVLSVTTLLHLGGHGPAQPLIRMVAWTEIAGAFLMLLPWTAHIGAGVLLVVFAAAAAIHFLHGEWNVAPLVIYAAATQVFVGGRRARAAR